MMAYAVENAEVAMYESLAQAAQLAGDSRTEELARQIQRQEKETADKVWAQVAPAARRAMEAVPETALEGELQEPGADSASGFISFKQPDMGYRV